VDKEFIDIMAAQFLDGPKQPKSDETEILLSNNFGSLFGDGNHAIDQELNSEAFKINKTGTETSIA